MPGATGTEVPYANAPGLVPPVSGLLAQLGITVDPFGSDEMWLNGVVFRPDSIQGLDLRDICDGLTVQTPSGQVGILDTAVQPGLRVFRPFSIEVREQCSTFGWNEANYVERATRALEVRRHQAVEREFEQANLITANPHLAQLATAGANFPTTTVNLAGGARVSPIDALALLDESIAEAGIGRGMIHATAFVVAQWAHAGMLRFELITEQESNQSVVAAIARAVLGAKADLTAANWNVALVAAAEVLAAADIGGIGKQDIILSPKGNLIIAGNGYQGADPASGDPDATHASQWAYATDHVTVLASRPETIPSTLTQATAQSRNLVVFRQTQAFSVLWGGLLHAVVEVATTTPAVA